MFQTLNTPFAPSDASHYLVFQLKDYHFHKSSALIFNTSDVLLCLLSQVFSFLHIVASELTRLSLVSDYCSRNWLLRLEYRLTDWELVCHFKDSQGLFLPVFLHECTIYVDLNFSGSYFLHQLLFRSFSVLMQPVDDFIIHNALQNCFTGRMKLQQKTFRKIFMQGNYLLALFIDAMSVNKEKIKRIWSCSLLYVDVVPSHIIGNACLGTAWLFLWFIFYLSILLQNIMIFLLN